MLMATGSDHLHYKPCNDIIHICSQIHNPTILTTPCNQHVCAMGTDIIKPVRRGPNWFQKWALVGGHTICSCKRPCPPRGAGQRVELNRVERPAPGLDATHPCFFSPALWPQHFGARCACSATASSGRLEQSGVQETSNRNRTLFCLRAPHLQRSQLP